MTRNWAKERESYLAGFAAAAGIARGVMYRATQGSGSAASVCGALRSLGTDPWSQGCRDGLAAGFGF